MTKINIIPLRSSLNANNDLLDVQREEVINSLVDNDFIIDEDGAPTFLIESGGCEVLFKSIYKNYKEPYNIISLEANNSLPASLEIVSFLNNNNLKSTLIHGNAKTIGQTINNINESIDSPSYLYEKRQKLNINNRLGVVGKPSDWLIASEVDYKFVKEEFSLELVDISFDEFVKEIEAANSDDCGDIAKLINNRKISIETINNSLKIYKALKAIVNKYQLSGLTVRCFDLLTKYKNTSCLALAMLNKEGVTATCEGDVPSLISMHLLNCFFNKPSFQCNPSFIDKAKNEIVLAHCTLPLNMASQLSFDTHFESNLGIGIKGTMEHKEVTIFKFSRDLKRFCLFQGSITNNLSLKNLCRSQIVVKTNSDALNLLVNKPCGNHLVLCYGDFIDEIKARLL